MSSHVAGDKQIFVLSRYFSILEIANIHWALSLLNKVAGLFLQWIYLPGTWKCLMYHFSHSQILCLNLSHSFSIHTQFFSVTQSSVWTFTLFNFSSFLCFGLLTSCIIVHILAILEPSLSLKNILFLHNMFTIYHF